MSALFISPFEVLEAKPPPEPRCAQCGERLDRCRAPVRGASMRWLCVDCAFDDAPQSRVTGSGS